MAKAKATPKKKTAAKVRGERPVIVCASNAILYGLAKDTTGDSITLRRARWVYHYRHPGGLLGVAADGPREMSRLGAEGTITLGNAQKPIACVIEVSEAGSAAIAAFPISNS